MQLKIELSTHYYQRQILKLELSIATKFIYHLVFTFMD